MLLRRTALVVLSLLFSIAGAFLLPAQSPDRAGVSRRAGADARSIAEIVSRLRDEGTNRSQMLEIFSYLTDVIGGRLTASPQCLRANEWTRDKLTSWGLTNAHLEAWGPFGRGWSLQRFSAQIVEPQSFPLIAWPKAWSCGMDWPIVADVVYLDARDPAGLEPYKGKLKGCIVLTSSPREISPRFEPVATRLNETNLLRLANSSPGRSRSGRPPFNVQRTPPTNRPPSVAAATPPPKAVTNAPATPPRTNEVRTPAVTNQPPVRRPRSEPPFDKLRFAVLEGAAATVSISPSGDAGAVGVGNASVIAPSAEGTNQPSFSYRPPWATNAPAGPPQIVLSAEQYNRVVRMLKSGEKVRMALEVQTRFHDRDPMCYNTLAEIPGGDLRKELVMLGAHIDSAPGGTGATDNAAGVAVCLEAVRLIKALKLEPRRTIRIGLWSGEEQGLLGSRAYVERHFGYYTNKPPVAEARSPRDGGRQPAPPSSDRPASVRSLVKTPGYQAFSAYYNLDNGAGRIRGIHLQGNEALRPLFREWLEPLRDFGADTIAASNTGGTDHLSFDAIGLPGFQFIQDPVEYWRSYHNTLDVRERAPIEDLQQAAIVMAAFVYQTAMIDEPLPRKPAEEERRP